MVDDNSKIVERLYELYKSRGYITEDEIYDAVIEDNISIFETNSILEKLLGQGVLVQEKHPLKQEDKKEETYVSRHIDYEELFSKVINVCPELKRFIHKIKKIQPPQRGEWVKLLEQLKNGNSWAYNRMFEMYLRVVVNIAWNMYKRYDLSLEDAVQDGCLGLMYAIEKFDITEHNSFPGYLPLAISNYIRRNIEFAIIPVISFPTIFQDGLLKSYPIIKEHICDKCDNNTLTCPNLINDLLEELKCSDEEVKNYLLYFQDLCSVGVIDEFINTYETPHQEEKIHQSEVIKIINQSFEGLTEREEFVLRMRMGIGLDEPMSLVEIGNKFNLTRERVRQIETKAFNKFKHPTRLSRIKQLFNNFL